MRWGTTKAKRFFIWIVVTLGVLTIFYWFALPLAAELVRHPEQTLSVLAWIESYKRWFFVVRVSVYASVYFFWGWILQRCKPDISTHMIVDTRKVLVRFFIVYEVFFGFNIIALLLR
jgi:hypothetical protein